jgi:hypothetical protein
MSKRRYAKDAPDDPPRKKRRLVGSGGHSNASDLSTLQIGAKKEEDDAPFPSSANGTPSICSTRSIPITYETIPSLTTYAARGFADNLVNLYKTEEDGQVTREWLKELPEHTLMKVWKMLIDRWPQFLTNAFISAVRHLQWVLSESLRWKSIVLHAWILCVLPWVAGWGDGIYYTKNWRIE